jgi:flavin reductase (DIM6/NTAB) family NADH-FMN oxidoreductase RutF
MHFASDEISPMMAYRLLSSTIIPRPIAFVTSMDEDGHLNAAPFSFFNGMGNEPPTLVLGFLPNADGSQKDTPRNILATGEFVVNLVDEALVSQMNMAAASLPPDVDELAHAGLATQASLGVSPPRIKASPVSMECLLSQDMPLKGGGVILIGEVIHFHLRDDVISSQDPLRIEVDKLDLVSRLNGPLYGRTRESFELSRPK